MTFESRRRSYERGSLDRSDVCSDPIAQLGVWLEAAEAAKTLEPNAMCVATVGRDGAPSARMVLLRGLDAGGLRFYTSYFSRKGEELRENPRIAATFYWPELERQIRIEGEVSELSEDVSDAYFATRPRGSQLSAWASEQSRPIEDRALLEERRAHFEARFEGAAVPRPHSWGGYLIVPSRVEFWQGRENRLHDRILYERRAGDHWNIVRLQP
jgi:pyridoxamine 5'-phosphate oxidase